MQGTKSINKNPSGANKKHEVLQYTPEAKENKPVASENYELDYW